MAAQLMAMKGPDALGPMECRVLENNSLPTPLSPRNSTVASVGATRVNNCATALKPADAPISSYFDAAVRRAGERVSRMPAAGYAVEPGASTKPRS